MSSSVEQSTDLIGPTGPVRRRRGRLLGASLVALAAVIVAAAVFAHWRSDLRYFGAPGDEQDAGHVPVGATVYFGGSVEPSQPGRAVDAQTLTPLITVNSARATVRVLLCRSGVALGLVRTLTPYCTSAATFRPGRYVFTIGPVRLESRPSASQAVSVIVAVTPSRAGRVEIAGLRIGYSDGIRQGDQLVGAQDTTST